MDAGYGVRRKEKYGRENQSFSAVVAGVRG
jgi:hypothetical protein